MDRPFRPVSPEFSPSKSVDDVMRSSQIKNMVSCSGSDCSGIARKLLYASGGKGEIIEVRPSKAGGLNLYGVPSVDRHWAEKLPRRSISDPEIPR
ncbi:hypothetical protein D3C76_1188320 [compost metagenome]